MKQGRILLLGASGMLGSRFANRFSDLDVVSLERSLLEVAQPARLMEAVQSSRASIIVNCVADTDVERAESEPTPAFAVNALLPGLLGQAARRMDALLVHFSSTGCYGPSGDSLEPHSDFAPLRPTTVHHRSKAEGEAAILASGSRHLILRLGWLYGGSLTHRKNFVRGRILEAREKPELFSDPYQIGSPTDVDDVVFQTQTLLEEGIEGTYNCVALGCVSRFDYVRHILASAELSVPLLPRRFTRRAPVSPNEAARNDKLVLLGLNQMPAWDVAVSRYVKALLEQERATS